MVLTLWQFIKIIISPAYLISCEHVEKKKQWWSYEILLLYLKQWKSYKFFDKYVGNYSPTCCCWLIPRRRGFLEDWGSVFACSSEAVKSHFWCADPTALWTGKGLGWEWLGCCTRFLPLASFPPGLSAFRVIGSPAPFSLFRLRVSPQWLSGLRQLCRPQNCRFSVRVSVS